MQDFNFEGFDYGELAHFFGAVTYDEDGETYSAEGLQAWLRSDKAKSEHPLSYGWKTGVIAACRAFVKALTPWTEKNGYSSSLWKGLAAIEDDETFMQYFITLVPHAWD